MTKMIKAGAGNGVQRNMVPDLLFGTWPADSNSPWNPMQQYAQYIEQVRKIAVSHLARCGCNPDEMTQSFLFTEDHFVGVHFRGAGAEVKWLFGNKLVDLVRGGDVIARMSLDEAATGIAVKRAA